MLIRRATMALTVLAALLGLAAGDGARGADGAPASPRPAAAPSGTAPTPGALYSDGPDGRYLLGGQWLFRLDPSDVGLGAGYATGASASGWSAVTVPNVWNATDQSDASMSGNIGWYRRDFRLPLASPTLAWIVRFESVNFRSQIWLNGRPIGSNVGAYLPFELQLRHLRLRGVNRLVIRVDSRLVNPRSEPQPAAGWWNYGGLLGEVYLRAVDRVDFQRVTVRPTLPCRRCNARIETGATVRNFSSLPQTVHVRGRYGPLALDLGALTIAAGQQANFSATAVLAHPRLWSPAHPDLYTARLSASAVPAARGSPRRAQPTRAAGYTVLSGVRSIRVTPAGQLQLNGIPVHFRGVSIHQDNPVRGAALHDSDRARIIERARDLGASLIRAHYPLHPELEELADRAGILLWSEIPMYQLSERELGTAAFTGYGRAQLRANILANQNHPSVAVWSLGNELPTMPGPAQRAYIASQTNLAKRLDPTRPVGLAVSVNPFAGCQTQAYVPLDVIGFNDYFGWYPGSAGSIADRDELSAYLDSLHACYPRHALAITEFGAEANRAGPEEEKGTYAFQGDFARFHLFAYGAKPWLAGASYFTLQEFRVQPGWSGGNPRPAPPVHEKGLISFAGVEKPAYSVVRGIYRGMRQFG